MHTAENVAQQQQQQQQQQLEKTAQMKGLEINPNS
jgi:hypothetical protein